MVWTIVSSILYDLLLCIYLALEIKFVIRYFKNKDNETSFNQIGLPELTLFIIILGVIFWSLRESGKSKQIKKADYLLDVKSNYNKALDTYINVKNWEKAAETIVKSPPGTQIVLLRKLQSNLPQSKIKAVFMKLGENYNSQKQANLAASAFLLAEMPWRAAQSYISSKNVSAAIDVINTTPIFSQDKIKATRNLAKYAFDNNYSVEAAQLLQSIGAEDEAVAVLIAAGRNANTLKRESISQPRPVVTSQISNSNSIPQNPNIKIQTAITPTVKTSPPQSSSVGQKPEINTTSPFLLISQELAKSQEKIKEGKIGEADEIIQKYIHLLDKIPVSDSEESVKLKSNFTKVEQALKRLNDARISFKNRKIEESQILYSELLESTGDLFNSEIFAEAGLAYEYEPADKELASEFFVEASRKAKTPQAAQRYKERADLLLESMNEELPKAPEGEKIVAGKQLTINPNEKCCVCKRPIGTDGEVVQCNSCKSVAHYPHMAEWLKIKGVCPVCKQKLTMPETSRVALTE